MAVNRSFECWLWAPYNGEQLGECKVSGGRKVDREKDYYQMCTVLFFKN